MQKKVPLGSLSVGRCFTLPVEPGPPQSTDDSPDAIRQATPILAPDQAWKVTISEEPVWTARSATGEEKAFPPDTVVVEISRQGYDRLLEQANQP